MPVYPAVMILAGVAATWGSSRLGRGLVALAVVWLAGATLWVHPHYLSYFNELIGGPARGHLYLADSNLDWGQDLKRLAAYAQRHPTEAIKLAYFGSADPTHYGFACRSLPSFLPFGKPADLDAGTYVVSANQLLGIYEPSATDAFWSPQQVEEYRALTRVEAAGRAARRNAEEYYQFLRRGRLLNQLQRRPPDERIGYSLFVYRLTQPDLDALLRP